MVVSFTIMDQPPLGFQQAQAQTRQAERDERTLDDDARLCFTVQMPFSTTIPTLDKES